MFDDGPFAEAVLALMANQHAQPRKRPLPVADTAGDMAHHIGIGEDGVCILDVGERERPDQQAWSCERERQVTN